MAKYQATVVRDGRFWLIQIDGVGSTQPHHRISGIYNFKVFTQEFSSNRDSIFKYHLGLGQA